MSSNHTGPKKVGQQVVEMLEQGLNFPQICNALGVAKSTVAYHAKLHGKARFNLEKDVDWKLVQTSLDAGEDLSTTANAFGLKFKTLWHARRCGYVYFERPRSVPKIEDMFIAESKYDGGTIKKRVLRDALIPYICANEDCNLHYEVEWRSQPISLHLDHIDGVRNNHVLSNLRFLCPNCHSQTSTYCGRNK